VLEIRAAEPRDAAAIAGVHVRTWQGAYRHVFPAEGLDALTVDERTAGWHRVFASGRQRVFVTVRHGTVVGFVSIGPSRDDDAEGELYAIYVLPEEWGRGSGRLLMDAALAALREDRYGDAILWVLEDNPRTRRFYERSGWTVDGARKRERFLGVEAEEIRYRIELGGGTT
jgi:ribosomal protein S18 acetylase RimI-like enzyme